MVKCFEMCTDFLQWPFQNYNRPLMTFFFKNKEAKHFELEILYTLHQKSYSFTNWLSYPHGNKTFNFEINYYQIISFKFICHRIIASLKNIIFTIRNLHFNFLSVSSSFYFINNFFLLILSSNLFVRLAHCIEYYTQTVAFLIVCHFAIGNLHESELLSSL